MLRALPEHVVRSIADLLQPGAPADLYTQLRRRLLASHGLTRYQRLERLSTIGQKPSELLAVLMQLGPEGEGNTTLFRFEFLKRLPRDIRIILAEADADLTALAARADVLWSHNSHHGSTIATIAKEEPEEVTAGVNALQPARGGNQRGAAPAADASPAEFGMCFAHFVYGANAKMCGLPGTCTWQGN